MGESIHMVFDRETVVHHSHPERLARRIPAAEAFRLLTFQTDTDDLMTRFPPVDLVRPASDKLGVSWWA